MLIPIFVHVDRSYPLPQLSGSTPFALEGVTNPSHVIPAVYYMQHGFGFKENQFVQEVFKPTHRTVDSFAFVVHE